MYSYKAGLLYTWKAEPLYSIAEWLTHCTVYLESWPRVYLEDWPLVYLERWPMQANLELLLKLGEDLDESHPRLCQQLVPGYILVWIKCMGYYYYKILKH